MKKPIDKLTQADLEKHDLWEWITDEEGKEDTPGQDETWVRPVALEDVYKHDPALNVVADMEMTDGTKFLGLVTVDMSVKPPKAEDLSTAMFGEQRFFLFASCGEKTYREEFLLFLNKKEKEVFPITYVLRQIKVRKKYPIAGAIK